MDATAEGEGERLNSEDVSRRSLDEFYVFFIFYIKLIGFFHIHIKTSQ